MVIAKTPFRVSFFGGGTDYPEHFEEHGGAVLGTAIDKSIYHTVMRFHSQLFDYSIRIAYRKVECVRDVQEIEHHPFRACLEWCQVDRDVEVDLSAELPSHSGLGGSSAFVVGLLNALYAHQGRAVPPIELAYQAIDLERRVLQECVGCQDQVFAAVGGFNLVEFRSCRDIVVHRVTLNRDKMQELEQHLMLVSTGIRRRAHELALAQVQKVYENHERLRRMRSMVDRGHAILTGNESLARFGELLHEAWLEKQQLGGDISNDQINQMYRRGLEGGALGGKLLGAGGGGFILFFVPPDRRQAVRQHLDGAHEIPIRLNAPGTHIIHAT